MNLKLHVTKGFLRNYEQLNILYTQLFFVKKVRLSLQILFFVENVL
jgi:hypothetical protein